MLYIIAEFGFDKSRGLVFERVLQAGAVYDRSLLDVAHHLLDRVQSVPFFVDHHAEVRAADAEGVHDAVQFLVLQGGDFHIAVGADALDGHILAEQLDGDSFIPL